MPTPLKKLRLRRKQTLLVVARAIGTDTGNLSRIERGLQKSLELAEKLVMYFGKGSISEAEILYPERFLGKAPREARAPTRSKAVAGADSG